jgi:formylglycine-generating enzyme required for sulfatase activity
MLVPLKNESMEITLGKSSFKATLLLISFTAFMLVSCDLINPPDDPNKPPVVVDSLGISISSVNFGSDKDASLLEIRTNKTWTATETADWLSLSATTGTKNTGILIGATKNNGLLRESSVTITAGDKTSVLKVVQAASPTILINLNNTTFKMILVEGGTYFMGNSEDPSRFGYAHLVQLSDFYISETEVTNELWNAVKGSLPYTDHSEADKPTLPVSETVWNKITTDFIPALNLATGKTFRLPTEAEWEYAALGGKKTHKYKYAGSATLDDVAWFLQNGNSTKHNVKEKLPNELGLYDMSGNVNEWCSDWYDLYYGWTIANQVVNPPPLQTNPKGPDTGTKKVVRGGSIDNEENWGFSNCNVKARSSINPTGYDTKPGNSTLIFMSKNTGFRLVISL